MSSDKCPFKFQLNVDKKSYFSGFTLKISMQVTFQQKIKIKTPIVFYLKNFSTSCYILDKHKKREKGSGCLCTNLIKTEQLNA